MKTDPVPNVDGESQPNHTEIGILFDFLERFGPEVAGREYPQPEKEHASKLKRFAEGKCDNDERAEVCSLLRQHPGWLRWLAERVKDARTHRGVSVAH